MKTFDGFEGALVGAADVWHPGGNRVTRAVYSGEMIVVILMSQGMSPQEAHEYCDFNIEGNYAGEDTPVIFWDGILE